MINNEELKESLPHSLSTGYLIKKEAEIKSGLITQP